MQRQATNLLNKIVLIRFLDRAKEGDAAAASLMWIIDGDRFV